LPPIDPEEDNSPRIETIVEITSKRTSAPEALTQNAIIVSFDKGALNNFEYGLIGYSHQQQEWQFYLPLAPDSLLIELLWSVPLSRKYNERGEAIFPRFILSSDNTEEPIIIQYGNELYRLDKYIIFDPSLQTARRASLSSPLVELDDSSNPLELDFVTEENTLYFRDGDVIKSADELGTLKVEKNVIDDLNTINFSFSKESLGFTIRKQLSAIESSVVFISDSNIETTIEPNGVISRFSSKERLYETIAQNSEGKYIRIVESYLGGDINFPELVNATYTNWVDYSVVYPGNLQLKSALLSGEVIEDQSLSAIPPRETSISAEPIQQSRLYLFPSLGRSSEFIDAGSIEESIVEIDLVEIIADDFGLVTAKTTEGTALFYFNPRDAQNEDASPKMQKIFPF
jgi:hypothetical protein